MMKFLLTLTTAWLVSCETITNMNVVTYMAVNHHLVKTVHRISFINSGSVPVNNYIFLEDQKNPLTGCFDHLENKLNHRESVYNSSLMTYTIKLNEEIKPKEVFTITCHVVLVDELKARHKVIYLKDDSTAVFEANMLYFSIYNTVLHKLFVAFETLVKDVYTECENGQMKDNILSFSASNLEPFSFKRNRYSFRYNKPIFVVKSLIRKIHVSMYGKIFIEDNVVIQNRANRILGDFHDVFFFSKIPKDFLTFLPASAEDIKFFDILGNNSMSAVIPSSDDVTLQHKPRYPLLGGWQYSYTIQYYVPIYEYLFTDNHNSFYLQMRAIDHVISNTFIEEAVTYVSLPEFATITKVTVPKKFTRRKDEISNDKLSFFGNPTVVFNGSYLTEDDIYPFLVKFTYNEYYALSCVILFIIYVESVFLLYLVWKKIFL